MVIDFNDIELVKIDGFKGGEGELDSRDYVDENNKIMYSTLKPGARSGLHTHNGDSEIAYIISGTATCYYDGNTEIVHAGQVHYCQMGHTHYMENKTDEDLIYLAIVPRHN